MKQYIDENWFSYFLRKLRIRGKRREEGLLDWLWNHVSWVLGRRQVTFWFQRRTRGFDDSELWSLDDTICRFAAPRIRFLSKKVNGFPTDLLYTDDESYELYENLPDEEKSKRDDEAFKEWKEILNKMADSMEMWEDFPIFEEGSEEEKKFNEGFELFHKYFFALWD